MLSADFYKRDDVVQVAKELLGKLLVTNIDGVITSGIITETEAYAGINDKASHAYGGRRTDRTKVMYHLGGVAYVYLCYGIHHLFNVVTNQQDVPHAVLIRAVEPVEGVDVMLERRNKTKITSSLTSGPGALSQALGLHTKHTGFSLHGPEIMIKEGRRVGPDDVMSGTRVGVAYADEDAYLPYHFWIKDSPYVSKGKGL